MAKNRVIVDCYTDEPAGLGVPPYLGVWPRYIAGYYRDLPEYLTIDDLRLANYNESLKNNKLDPPRKKTRTDLINHTKPFEKIQNILKNSKQIIFVGGINTPGKYLSARPATLKEIKRLSKNINATKIITGPVAEFGTQQYGGTKANIPDNINFNEIKHFKFENYQELQDYALKGSKIYKQIPQIRIIEIETGRGCIRRTGCSFCTEPLKHKLEWRDSKFIIDEVKEFMKLGAKNFRLGKQSCIFSYKNGNYKEIEKLLTGLSELKPNVLHIDNANPIMIDERRTKLFVKYLTAGSTAALGVESFDEEVIKQNNLNSNFYRTYEAIKILNKFGGERGENGCYRLLPGINILLGLIGETKNTLAKNFSCLKKILDDDLLFRRINIRKVVPYPGTKLAKKIKNHYLQRNKKYYNKWIKKVREEIDLPMLKRLFPKGIILKNLYSEIHYGSVTFLRQIGSYPIIVGIRKRLPLGNKYNVKITGYMLRSLVGELV